MIFIIFFCFIGICCAYLSRVHVKKLTSLKDQLDEKNKQARIEEIKSLLRCNCTKLVNPTLPEVINNNRLVREFEELTGQEKTESYGLSFESLEDCHIALAERFKVDIAETSRRRGHIALSLTKGHLDRKYKSDSH